MNCDFGNAFAIRTVDQPWPQPTSATLAPALQLGHDAVERRQPVLHEVVQVAGPEEPRDGAEQAAGLVAPGDAAAGPERRLDLGLVLDHAAARSKAPIM